MKNNKGFTLIELLAVIVVLGIIMLIAVTSVSGVIEKSRKDSFVATARAYISAVRLQLSTNNAVDDSGNTGVGLPTCGSSVLIPIVSTMAEKGGVTSPYNQSYDFSKVDASPTVYSVVKVTGGTAVGGVCPYTYSIFLIDSGNHKIGTSTSSLIDENSLTSTSVT